MKKWRAREILWIRHGWLWAAASICACAVVTSPIARKSKPPGASHNSSENFSELPRGEVAATMVAPGDLVFTDPQERPFQLHVGQSELVLLAFMPVDDPSCIAIEKELRDWLAEARGQSRQIQILSIHATMRASHRLAVTDVDGYQHAVDPQASLFLRLNLADLPSFVLVDADGTILSSIAPGNSQAQRHAALQSMRQKLPTDGKS